MAGIVHVQLLHAPAVELALMTRQERVLCIAAVPALVRLNLVRRSLVAMPSLGMFIHHNDILGVRVLSDY
jgi:hypothetical protein